MRIEPYYAETAWAAGFFEGEGTVRVKNDRGVYRGAMSVINSDLDVLQRFAEWAGCGTIYDYKSISPLSKKPLFRWEANAEGDIRRMIGELLIFMGARRAAKMIEVLDSLDLRVVPA